MILLLRLTHKRKVSKVLLFGFLAIGLTLCAIFLLSFKALPLHVRGVVILLAACTGFGVYLGFGPSRYGSKIDDNHYADLITGKGGLTFEDISPESLVANSTFDRLTASHAQDPEKWISVAIALRQQRDFDRAAKAFSAAAQIVTDAREKASYYGAAGEALVERSNGQVRDDAVMLFQQALMADETSTGAHYYLGRWRETRKDTKQAALHFQQFLLYAPADHPLRTQIASKIAKLPAARSSVLSTAIAPDLAQSAIDEVAALSPEDQQEFIQSMVARLQARLDENGGDVESWRRLARAYVRLGDAALAKKAYDRAITMSPNPDVLILERNALQDPT